MVFSWFSFYGFTVGFLGCFLLWNLLVGEINPILCSHPSIVGVFSVDTVGWCLFFLVVLLFFCLIPLLLNINKKVGLLIFFSCLCGGLSFVSNNCLVFWFCYEASIISVLFLLYLDSPYSERFVAGWYLIGYSVFSGVPLLWFFVYVSNMCGSFLFLDWGNCFDHTEIFVILALLFTTKIPLAPFYTWLPIVHAEASTIVSVCLSGYIMKLGVIGVYRVSSFLFPDVVSLTLYTFFVVLFCILCFFSSLVELDGKRWLAFLSLSHMAVVLLCFVCYSGLGYSAMALFGLSHGMSSGFLFLLIWFFSHQGGSRNVLYFGWCFNTSWFLIFICFCGFCYVANFPPSIGFFIEVWLVGFIINNSNLISVFLVYLFLSSLIPIILFGFGFIRRMGVDNFNSFMFSSVVSMLSLIVFPLIISLI